MKIINYSLTGEFSEPITEFGKGAIIALDCRLMSTHQLILPNMSGAKALKAIPFALEKQLLDDINLLQFFPIKSTLANQWDVLVIAKDVLKSIEQKLQKAKCRPHAIVPDFVLLPFTEGKVSYIESEGVVTFRNGLHQGGCLETSQFHQLFKDSVLLKTSQTFDPQSKINLHTRDNTKANKGHFRPWRLPLAMALIAVLLASAQIWNKNTQLEAQLDQLTTSNEQQFRTLFPGVKRIVNIRVQSRQGLANALKEKTRYQNDLLSKLVTEVFPNSQASKIVLKNQQLSVEIFK